MDTLLKRKGARRIAEVPADVLTAISTGQVPTVNLVEYLAADLTRLLPAVATQIGIDARHPLLLQTIARLPDIKPMQRHWAIAASLLEVIGNDAAAESLLSRHPSDLARQWAALMVGLQPGLSLSERLRKIRPFAADRHFGVREMAWLAVRNAVAAEVLPALDLLTPWSMEADPNLRRFASELTRPRGVWCVHLEELKHDPAPAYALLSALRADPSRYVQNSVGNWLNDAAKSRPDWVGEVCQEWSAASDCKHTLYICKRGLRSITGQGQHA